MKRLIFLAVKQRCTDPELRPVAGKTELLHLEGRRVLLLKHRKLDLLQTETGDEETGRAISHNINTMDKRETQSIPQHAS